METNATIEANGPYEGICQVCGQKPVTLIVRWSFMGMDQRATSVHEHFCKEHEAAGRQRYAEKSPHLDSR